MHHERPLKRQNAQKEYGEHCINHHTDEKYEVGNKVHYKGVNTPSDSGALHTAKVLRRVGKAIGKY